MSTARILIKQGDTMYRFMRFEASTDGSLQAFLDRDPRSSRGGMTMNENGVFVPEENASDRPTPSTRFSIHTTGEIHRHLGGEQKSTIYIEPLHALTRVHLVGLYQFPAHHGSTYLMRQQKFMMLVPGLKCLKIFQSGSVLLSK